MMEGYSLVSQQIRELILDGTIKVPETELALSDNGQFVDNGLERRVQPASFEPTLGDEAFVLNTDRIGLFRPNPRESVYKSLLQVPRRHRERRDISEGFELKRGFTYLIPLEEKIKSSGLVGKVTYIRSSPKSSTGRVFPKTRLIADYNRAFDEIGNGHDQDLGMWLVVQPLPFNLIVRPGISLNQLRFFNGASKLSPQSILDEASKTPLLYSKGDDSTPIEVVGNMANDGVQLTLDLEGQTTDGVVGLRARNNPDPIDLSMKSLFDVEDYFEAIMKGEVVIERGHHYLFASNQVIYTPPHLSAELRRHSHEGIEGRSHDAGFVDPGFRGDMVFEVSPDEVSKVRLNHDMPLSRLDFFRSHQCPPDKLYGNQIGSHYQHQQGPKPSKNFKTVNFGELSKKHKKMDRDVLVQDEKVLRKYRINLEGFEFMSGRKSLELFEDIENNGFFHSRYDCEEDRLVLQPIPYILIFGPDETVFSYIRSSKIEDYGDTRLHGKHSIGIGGHIKPEDGPNYILSCLKREMEEEVRIKGDYGEPIFLGTLFSRRKPVDEVHLGLIYKIHANGDVVPNEPALVRGEMVPIDLMRIGYHEGGETETWSELLIPHLGRLYEFR